MGLKDVERERVAAMAVELERAFRCTVDLRSADAAAVAAARRDGRAAGRVLGWRVRTVALATSSSTVRVEVMVVEAPAGQEERYALDLEARTRRAVAAAGFESSGRPNLRVVRSIG